MSPEPADETIIVTRRKPTKRGVRAWYRCVGCGMYGAISVGGSDSDAVVDDVIAKFNAGHECPAAAGGVSG